MNLRKIREVRNKLRALRPSRHKFFRFLKEVAGIPEGSLLPPWSLVLKCILFPTTALKWKLESTGPIVQEFYTGTVMIYGRRYTEEFLQAMARYPVGTKLLLTCKKDFWEIQEIESPALEGGTLHG